MADKKITALTESTALSTDDLFHVVDSPASSPSNKKISANNVFQKVPTWIGYAGTGIQAYTSATSALTVTGGLVLVTTGGTATTPALANGTAGQLVTFVLDVDGGGNSVITPATKSGFTAATLTDVGDSATMIYTATRGWVTIAAQSGSAGGGDAILG
mgnify:CR=1 FL=1